MIDQLPKPKRHYRRWIIVGVLLFLVGFAGCEYWPRGDRRVVGVWQVSISDGNSRLPVFRVSYFRNGTMSYDNPQQQKNWPFRRWRVEGTQLIWGSRLPLPKSSFSQWLVKQLRRLPGMANVDKQHVVQMIKLTDDEIELFDPKNPIGTHILTRLPE